MTVKMISFEPNQRFKNRNSTFISWCFFSKLFIKIPFFSLYPTAYIICAVVVLHNWWPLLYIVTPVKDYSDANKDTDIFLPTTHIEVNSGAFSVRSEWFFRSRTTLANRRVLMLAEFRVQHESRLYPQQRQLDQVEPSVLKNRMDQFRAIIR